MNVLGVENVDYTSSKTGRHVTGIRLHVAYDKKGCDGVAVDNFFCKTAAFPDGVPSVGDDVEILYNRWGNVESVRFSR